MLTTNRVVAYSPTMLRLSICLTLHAAHSHKHIPVFVLVVLELNWRNLQSSNKIILNKKNCICYHIQTFSYDKDKDVLLLHMLTMPSLRRGVPIPVTRVNVCVYCLRKSAVSIRRNNFNCNENHYKTHTQTQNQIRPLFIHNRFAATIYISCSRVGEDD